MSDEEVDDFRKMAEKEVEDLLMEIRFLEYMPDQKEKFVKDLKEILTKIVLLVKKK